MEKTPRVSDPDIMDRIRKYPVIKPDPVIAPKSTDFVLGLKHVTNLGDQIDSSVLKKCLTALTSNIDRASLKNKKFYDEMIAKWVTQDLRHEEIKRI